MRAFAAAAALAAASVAAAHSDSPAPREDGPDITGWVVDARTGKPPLVQAVAHVSWTLRPESPAAKARTKQVVKEVASVVGGRFYIVDWKRHVDARGYKLVPGKDPVVRLYAPGYRRVVIENTVLAKGGKRVPVNAPGKEWKWVAEGAVQALQPVPDDPAAIAAELAIWRRDIDADLAAIPAGERDAALRDRDKLLLAFDQACAPLRAAPASACYAVDSPIGRHIAAMKAERSKYVIVEQPGGKVMKHPFEVQTVEQAGRVTPR